jgi:hypothetical protein
MKLSVTVGAFLAVITAMSAPSLVGRARAQSAVRVEYLRVIPHRVATETPGRVVHRWAGYQACVAAGSSWNCRQFHAENSALHTTLARLGDEGWELVSAVDERHEADGSFGGLTYLFKRQRQ